MKKTTIIVGGVVALAGIGAIVQGQDKVEPGAASPSTQTTTVEQAAETTTPPPTTEPEPEPSPSWEMSTAPPAPPLDSNEWKDQAFMDTLEVGGIVSESTPPDTFITMGELVCNAYDQGSTTTQVTMAISEGGWGVYESAYIAGAAVGIYCPEYMDKISG